MNRRLLALTAVLAIGLAACDEERANVNEPDYPEAYGFSLSPAATNLPRGTARFLTTGAESVTVTLTGLDSLSSGAYTAWLGDSLGTNFVRVTGALSVVRVDTTFNSDGIPIPNPVTLTLGNVSSFRNGGSNQTFTWRFTRAASGVGTGPMQHLVISVEDSDGATTINSSRRPIFARRGDAALASGARTPALIFGNYAPLAENQYRFVPTVRGRGFFRGQTLVVNDSTMSRPPRGYYYAMYVYKRSFGAIQADTQYLGEQRSPYPNRALSQRNADSIVTDPANVFDTPYYITAGSVLFRADTVASLPAAFPFKDFFEVWMTLQSKNAEEGRMGIGRMAFGVVPAVISVGERQ
jgi:hypothetical protein